MIYHARPTKLDEISKLYKCWLYRHLTPLGRITVIKSLALSKLTHVVLVCPHMTEKYVVELEKMTFNFLWKGKPDRIKRVTVVNPYEKGGLKAPKISIFWDSLKLSWTRRLLTSGGIWQKILQLDLLQANYEIKDLWYGGPSLLQRVSLKLSNPFWKEVVLALQRLQDAIPYVHPHLFFT